MSNANMPGHYHAEGDPEGTVRYWDGSQWEGGPIPAPPGSPGMAPPPPDFSGMAPPPAVDTGRFADVGVRLAANVIDFIINVVATVLLVLVFSAGNSVNVGFTGAAFITLIAFGIYTFILGQYGGTPGKLVVGLRVTTADGTTPPGFSVAAKRNAPYLITILPFLGALVILVVLIVSIVFVSNDAERRSVFDRVGDTRVVFKNRL